MLRMTLVLLTLAILLGCNRDTAVEPATKSPLGQAVVLLLNNQHDQALALCDSVLEEKPNDFDAIMLRGEICEALGDTEGAIVAYEQGATQRPHASQPQRLLEQLRPREIESDTLETKTMAVAMVNSADIATDQIDDTNPLQEIDIAEVPDDGLLDGHDKSYRDPPTEIQQQERARQQRFVPPAPRNDFLTRMQAAIAEGQRLDALARQQIPHAEPERLSDPDYPQGEEDRPLQITRFDFGLGIGTAPINAPRTTGQRSSMTTRRAFVSASRVRPAKGHAVDHCQPSRGGASFTAVACGRL